jgi:hypothetical protein
MGLKSDDQDCQTAEEIHFWDDLYRSSQNSLRIEHPREGFAFKICILMFKNPRKAKRMCLLSTNCNPRS